MPIHELRTIQDWYLRYQLTKAHGVAEVASIGGFVQTYQVTVDPGRLRAYGIPERSPDGFLHAARNLRIGLALSARSGERLAVMGRKGRVNTLHSYAPTTGNESPATVPEDRLRAWLGGLSQGLFLAMFSLDHDALVRGGEALAQGRGDAGESLFEAGAGLTSIRALRGRLDLHRKIARVTFPIWIYVSVTGVVVYLMLYQM